MGIVILLMFDLSFVLFSCTEQVKIDSDILHSNTTMEIQHIASPSKPPLSPFKGEEHPSERGMGEAFSFAIE